MSTTIVTFEINSVEVPTLKAVLKKFGAKKVHIEETADDTKMSKSDFIAKIEDARKSKNSQPLKTEKEIIAFFDAI